MWKNNDKMVIKTSEIYQHRVWYLHANYAERHVLEKGTLPLLKDGIGVRRPNLGTWDLNGILRRRGHLRASPQSISFVFPLYRLGHSYCTQRLMTPLRFYDGEHNVSLDFKDQVLKITCTLVEKLALFLNHTYKLSRIKEIHQIIDSYIYMCVKNKICYKLYNINP